MRASLTSMLYTWGVADDNMNFPVRGDIMFISKSRHFSLFFFSIFNISTKINKS